MAHSGFFFFALYINKGFTFGSQTGILYFNMVSVWHRVSTRYLSIAVFSEKYRKCEGKRRVRLNFFRTEKLQVYIRCVFPMITINLKICKTSDLYTAFPSPIYSGKLLMNKLTPPAGQ